MYMNILMLSYFQSLFHHFGDKTLMTPYVFWHKITDLTSRTFQSKINDIPAPANARQTQAQATPTQDHILNLTGMAPDTAPRGSHHLDLPVNENYDRVNVPFSGKLLFFVKVHGANLFPK